MRISLNLDLATRFLQSPDSEKLCKSDDPFKDAHTGKPLREILTKYLRYHTKQGFCELSFGFFFYWAVIGRRWDYLRRAGVFETLPFLFTKRTERRPDEPLCQFRHEQGVPAFPAFAVITAITRTSPAQRVSDDGFETGYGPLRRDEKNS